MELLILIRQAHTGGLRFPFLAPYVQAMPKNRPRKPRTTRTVKMSPELTELAEQLRAALEAFIVNPLKDAKPAPNPTRKNPRKKDLRELERAYIAAFRAETKGTPAA